MIVERRELGVIDTLQAGFDTVTKHAWIISIPALLDLYFWLGPRLSMAPLAERLVPFLAPVPDAGAAYQEQLAQMRELLRSLGESYNLFSLLSQPLLRVPSLMGGSELHPSFIGGKVPTITLETPLGLLGTVLPLILLGVLFGCVYLDLIAGEIREQKAPLSARRILIYWLRMISLGILLVGLIIIFGMFSGVSIFIANVLNPTLGLILSLLWFSAGWLGAGFSFFAIFVIDAIILGEVGILRALWDSASVVRRNLWSSLGLFLLMTLIGGGLSLLWRRLGGNLLGTILGIVGNSYVGSSLAAASLIFYRDRYRTWQGGLLEREREVSEP